MTIEVVSKLNLYKNILNQATIQNKKGQTKTLNRGIIHFFLTIQNKNTVMHHLLLNLKLKQKKLQHHFETKHNENV